MLPTPKARSQLAPPLLLQDLQVLLGLGELVGDPVLHPDLRRELPLELLVLPGQLAQDVLLLTRIILQIHLVLPELLPLQVDGDRDVRILPGQDVEEGHPVRHLGE
jgi:hypothetical protein